MLTVLFLGDVVGEPGRNAVIARLPELKEQHGVDFIVVNGENAAGGRGITGKITIDLLRAGVSVVTTGDHVWDQKDILSFIQTEPRLLRPVNYPAGAPGSGSIVLETAKGKVGVIDVQCRTFMQPILENPFRAMDETVAKMREETANIIVDLDQVCRESVCAIDVVDQMREFVVSNGFLIMLEHLPLWFAAENSEVVRAM